MRLGAVDDMESQKTFLMAKSEEGITSLRQEANG